MKKEWIVIIILFSCLPFCRVNAQTIAVKTNVLPWMTGTLNLCGEMRCGEWYSLEMNLNYNPWTWGDNKKVKHDQTIFYLLFRLMGQYVDAEVKSAVGRADVVIKMQEAIYVFEFKVDGTPEEALAQINSKQYAIPYQADHRKVIKVGVNFDSSTRTIGEWIIEN